MSHTSNTNDAIRSQVQQLWVANFLNIRRATEIALQQGRGRLDLGVELINVTFDTRGEFFPGAMECLTYLSKTPTFGLHLWTIAAPDKVKLLLSAKLAPAHIVFHGHNENPLHTSVAWDQRKPWFDVLLDHSSGFDPGASQWYWAHHLFYTAAKSLANTLSGGTIIRTTGRFDVKPDPALQRRGL